MKKKATLLSKTLQTIALILLCAFDAWCTAKNETQIDVDTAVFLREALQLQELLVTPIKEKYSTKNNPAVELVRSIRQNQKKGDPRSQEKYSYDQYDKITLGLLDVSEQELQNHKELLTYLDTTAYDHRQTLKVLLNERAATTIYSDEGKNQKTIVRGKTSHGVSEMFDDDNIEIMLNEFLREVDIYDNDITVLTNKFPSPLSANGNIHYNYYITDTLDVEGMRCVQLTFIPRVPTDFTFSGNLYAELGDTTGFIRKVLMKVPRTVNLNFIDNLYIEQKYEKDSLGYRHKVLEKLDFDMCLVPGSQRFNSSRISRYDNFVDDIRTGISETYHAIEPYITIGPPESDNNEFLSVMRGNSLSGAESNMDTFMTKLRKYPLFYWGEKILVVLVNGYIKTGKNSKFDFGPINTFISTNPIESVRLRIGGMTTANLSPHWFARGYLAYGTRDRKFKYKAELEYSFNKKKYHSREYPINSLKITQMYDMDMIGQHYHFTNPDNIFLSLKRKTDKLITYRHLTKLEYSLELTNNLAVSLWGEHIKQDASPWLPFINGYDIHVPFYKRASLGASIRYAPGEIFLQGKENRISVNQDAPIFMLSQEWGPRGAGGSDYNICKTEISIWKRFWFSSFGYLDYLVKWVILWTQALFPELLWPNANLSYTIQPESYSLMNPMEFAMDKYASCDLTYWGNGVLFNRIPIIKKTQLREVAGFKLLWGNLSDKNDPSLHKNLFRFPEDAASMKIDRTPYMEISAGIDNIFKILRIDYVWRLSYLDTPGIDKSGLRVALHFNF
ncbi:MAG: carboxypeptidase-like regulatory domain-containing protein [Muribaculaceae bacterium]|nr:carboxypeptidase-like regulatory domain-containing protein [Muribaculaceae bacterium]